MKTIHSINILPNDETIQAIAELSAEFSAKQFDKKILLEHLQEKVLETKFMSKQDHAIWMVARGADFIANPKLFSVAPLTYTCAFIGELFNNHDIDEINQRVPQEVIELALLRLRSFTIH